MKEPISKRIAKQMFGRVKKIKYSFMDVGNIAILCFQIKNMFDRQLFHLYVWVDDNDILFYRDIDGNYVHLWPEPDGEMIITEFGDS